MSGRLLDFKSYVGGADNVVVEDVFPSSAKTYVYDYDTDLTNYVFTAVQQTVIADVVSYDRNTGLPNFTDTKIIGFFGSGTGTAIPGSNIINNGTAGTVNFTIPPDLYTGPIIPSARTNVPMTIVTFTWTNQNVTPNTIESHRWCLMQRWESSVSPADPILDIGYIPLGTGAALTFTDNSATDTSRSEGSYSITGLSSGQGTGATFSVEVESNGTTVINITARGTGYNVGDTIELLDVNMGSGGGADITVTVSTVA